MPRVTVLDTVGQRGFVSVCVKKQKHLPESVNG